MSRMHVVNTSNLAFSSGERGVRDSDGQGVQQTALQKKKKKELNVVSFLPFKISSPEIRPC